MKHITGYWIDEFDNKWNDILFTEEQAEAESKTLKNCKECENCRACENCDKCINCENCYGCTKCKNIEGLAGKFEMMGRHRRDYSKLGGGDGKGNENEN